jgi:hypothetical protein
MKRGRKEEDEKNKLVKYFKITPEKILNDSSLKNDYFLFSRYNKMQWSVPINSILNPIGKGNVLDHC